MTDTSLSGRHALVTGATGFVGANLVRALVDRGCSVTALVGPTSNLWRIIEVLPQLAFRVGRLEDRAALEAMSDDCFRDLVFHCGASGIGPGEGMTEMVRSNVAGTANLLDVAAAAGHLPRFVFCSSCSVYGQVAGALESAPLLGTSVYALSKIAGEEMVRAYSAAGSVSGVTLRLFTPYGPYEAAHRLVAGTMLAARRNGTIPLTAGEQKRDLIFIDDAVDALIAAAVASDVGGEIFNVSSGRSTTVRKAVELILETTPSRARGDFGALPYRANEVWEMSGDPSHLQQRLQLPAPRPLEAGLRATAEWFDRSEALYAN